uniref:proline-rich protein 18-like n=1 Tax=Scatophagus argus TaxID=75038 RepID=UPI001ED8549D|nr:proline-rich protein 18-like [Scatophagus argus]
MAEDASEYLASFRKSVSSLVPSSFFFQLFKRKTELLSYLILCIVKMPFIPPVSIARSVSGLTGRERPLNNTSSTPAVAKTKVQRDDKGSSVKERLASNLKQLGKKSQPRSHLPTAKGVSGAELHAKRKDRLLPSSQTDSFPASSSGESLSKTERYIHASQSSVKSEPEVKTRGRNQEEARFTLTLTPEAVLLLQRRNNERRQNSASRSAGSGGGVSRSTSDSRRRRENVSKRHQAAAQRHSTPNSRVPAKNNSDDELRDISSIMKISLLNEQHKYDDVEYEEEEDYVVDERVVLKCTEWLRGLENTPVTVGNGLKAV